MKKLEHYVAAESMSGLHHGRYRSVAVLLLVLQLGACYSWDPVTASPRQFIEDDQPQHIRIFQPDGTRTELRNPRVETDSLTAEVPVRLSPEEFGTETVRIPLTDVRAFEIQRFNIEDTLGLIGALWGGGWLLALSTCDCPE